MIKLEIAGKQDITKIQGLANEVWWSTYAPILSKEQIQYMLNTLYSKEALQTIVDDKHQKLIVLYEDDIEKAFASYGKRSDDKGIYKLHKLYVLPSQHKKGFGQLLIETIKTELAQIHIHTLELNVNRNNPAKSFYERMGFKIIKEEDLPIGPFWMNDYVMRLDF